MDDVLKPPPPLRGLSSGLPFEEQISELMGALQAQERRNTERDEAEKTERAEHLRLRKAELAVQEHRNATFDRIADALEKLATTVR
jgi:hypothetical protein